MTENEIAEPSEPSEVHEATHHESVPWSAWDLVLVIVLGLVFTFLLAFVVGFVFGFMDKDLPGGYSGFALFSLLAYGGFSLAALLLIFRRRKASLQDVWFTKPPAKALWLALPIALGCLLMNGVVGALMQEIFSGNVPDVSDQLDAGSDPLAVADYLKLLVVVALVAPITEEIMFRGLIYRYVKVRKGVAWATGISAVLFSIAHLIPLLIPTFILLGVILARLTERWKSIVPAMAVHALINATAITLLYLSLRSG